MAFQPSSKDFQDVYFMNKAWRCTVPNGVTLDEILAPAFWANVGFKLSRFDRIEVLSEDGYFDCELRVIDARRTDAVVKLIRAPLDVAPLPVADAGEKDLPRVQWAGPQHKFRVLDEAGAVYADNIASKDEANDKLAEYRARVQRRAA